MKGREIKQHCQFKREQTVQEGRLGGYGGGMSRPAGPSLPLSLGQGALGDSPGGRALGIDQMNST